ncbi:MAG: CYTH domain-containing protein [Omnitrophica WOR_2 bacterium]|jgi:adenylate cyclase
MSQEIERKFLVTGEFKRFAFKQYHIIQGYLSTVPERTVRVRIKDSIGFLTIKGIASDDGISRYEWEKEIPFNEAKELLVLCEPIVIDKTRYLIENGAHTFEVDEFHEDNEGLIIAEIELNSENESFNKPDWIGEEVSGDARYYNAALSKVPFKKWL